MPVPGVVMVFGLKERASHGCIPLCAPKNFPKARQDMGHPILR